MLRKELLLQRLDDIGKELEKRGGVKFLLGLGSVGIELDRIDKFSDLDFFVITERGHKQKFLDHLDWLEAVHPLAYYFKNYKYGFKVMFEDGIYGEFAVFEEWELEEAAYSEGRIVWRNLSYMDEGIAKPASSFPLIRAEIRMEMRCYLDFH